MPEVAGRRSVSASPGLLTGCPQIGPGLGCCPPPPPPPTRRPMSSAPSVTTPPSRRPASGGLDRFFSISSRGSTVQRELRGGLATFFTMAYIVVLNPLIVGTAKDGDGHILGVPFVAAATALVAGVMTILMGVIGRYPFALATGLGLNAFVSLSL